MVHSLNNTAPPPPPININHSRIYARAQCPKLVRGRCCIQYPKRDDLLAASSKLCEISSLWLCVFPSTVGDIEDRESVLWIDSDARSLKNTDLRSRCCYSHVLSYFPGLLILDPVSFLLDLINTLAQWWQRSSQKLVGLIGVRGRGGGGGGGATAPRNFSTGGIFIRAKNKTWYSGKITSFSGKPFLGSSQRFATCIKGARVYQVWRAGESIRGKDHSPPPPPPPYEVGPLRLCLGSMEHFSPLDEKD